MYVHKMLHIQVEEIYMYTYNGNNVNKCLAKIIIGTTPIFILVS